MITLSQKVMIRSNSCNRPSPGKGNNFLLTYGYSNDNTKARLLSMLSHEWLNHLSIHYRKPFTVCLNHSPTPDGEGMSRMREVRMSTSCSRAVKECGWHCPLSTEEQVYPFIHHHHHHQRIHTQRTQLVYRKHLDIITLLAERRATVFVAAGVRGRENQQDRYLHRAKKKRETHPDSSARQSHEHRCHWAWRETREKDIKIINITKANHLLHLNIKMYVHESYLLHVRPEIHFRLAVFLHHCSVEKMTVIKLIV